MSSNVIAIDGPAASGKSSVAKLLADRLQIPFLSTGALYRALAWNFLGKGMDLARPDLTLLAEELAATRISYEQQTAGAPFEVRIDGTFPGARIHTPEVSRGASDVAKITEVRTWLLDFQRSFAAGSRLVVLEGRDIGTAVFPDAKYKFYLSASPEVRAKRRLTQNGGTCTEEEIAQVAAQIAARDAQDMTRSIAPLRQAPDAVPVDNSGLDLEGTLELLLSHIFPADGGTRKTVLKYRVPYGDTDNMGVVYYANYYKYFEMFRTEYMIDAGYPYTGMEETGIALPVIESGCTYKNSARFEDVIEVTGRIAECKGVRIRIECEIHCRGKLLVSGFTVHACIDMKTRKPVRVPDVLKNMMRP